MQSDSLRMATTVTILANGPIPVALHLLVPTAVFINGDKRPHTILANPHPTHDECSGALNLGTLAPGEQRKVKLPTGTCFYHGEENPADTTFWGAVILH